MIDLTVEFEKLYAEPSRNGLYKPKEFHGSGVRIVNMGEMFAFPLIGDQEMQHLSVTDDEFNKFGLQAGDLLFARRSLVEEGAGKCSLIMKHEDPMVFESSMIRVRLNKELCNPQFYYYYFKSPTGRSRIESIITGAAQKGIRGSELSQLRVHNPPVSTQQRIAEILSNYDRLIDINNRRIALLEESTHLLYKEWFVKLRFPGYEEVAIENGVPEEWEKLAIDDAFQITGGGTPSKKISEYWQNGTINWYSPTDLTKLNTMFVDESGEQITDSGLENSSARLFPPFSVMMTSRATIGAIAINTTAACTNQGFITCLPNKRVPLYFLYCWLKSNVEIFINHSSGATFKEISKGVFKTLPIIIPPQALVKEFEEKAKPRCELILNLQRQNQKLSEARDRLLPRLMNGSILV